MDISGQHFSSKILAQIQQTVDQDPSLSRRALSQRICEWLDWRSANGRLKDMSCRKALVKMQVSGIIHLPQPTKRFAFAHPAKSLEPVVPKLKCSLGDLGEIRVTQ